jgi:hypothetical protein
MHLLHLKRCLHTVKVSRAFLRSPSIFPLTHPIS